MSYRTFQRPDDHDWSTTEQWLAWLDEQEVYVPVLPTQEYVCQTCWGPVRRRDDGERWWQCWNCWRSSFVQGVVPISYSWERGLESMIFWAKYSPQRRWLNIPLACLLHEFLFRHLDCIEARFGAVDLITVVSSNSATRQGWDHMKDMIGRVNTWPRPEAWTLDLLSKAAAGSVREDGRMVTHDAYQLSADVDLRDKRVLVIDDLWTSGSTLNSVAATIAAAGGQTVALPVGRQFRMETGEGADTEFQDSLEFGDASEIEYCPVHPIT